MKEKLNMTNIPTYKAKVSAALTVGLMPNSIGLDVLNGANTAIQLIQHTYFEYRIGIRDYQQNTISNFLDSIVHEFKSAFRNFLPETVAVSNCFQCGEPTLWVKKNWYFLKLFQLFLLTRTLLQKLLIFTIRQHQLSRFLQKELPHYFDLHFNKSENNLVKRKEYKSRH